MNRLFEKFVFRLVNRLLGGTVSRVHYQRGDRSIILNASTNRPYARVVPDVLIQEGAARTAACVALNAKYKLYDERKLSRVTCTRVYFTRTPTETPAVVFRQLFSCTRLLRRQSDPSGSVSKSSQTLAAAEILALGLSIPDILTELKGDIRGPATRGLIEAIQHGLGGAKHVAA